MPPSDAADSKRAEKPARVWVTRAEAIATGLLAIVFVVWTAAIVLRERGAGRDIRLSPSQAPERAYLIDLNEAEWPELMLLPGVGRVRAERAVQWREGHGRFTTLEEFRKAAGLAAKDVEAMRKMVTLGEERVGPSVGSDYVEPETE